MKYIKLQIIRVFLQKMVKFTKIWLTKTDVNGMVVNSWAKESSKGALHTFCVACNVNFKTDKGFEKINQHAIGAKHIVNMKNLISDNKSQITLNLKPVSTFESTQKKDDFGDVEITASLRSLQKGISNQLVSQPTKESRQKTKESELPIHQYQVALNYDGKDALKAELLWCLEVISSRSSFNSCANKRELFQAMFPCETSEKFSLSPKKASYLITDALSPYFRKMLLDEVQQDVQFTLQFDETSNKKNPKEMEMRIFFCPTKRRVINSHLETKFLKNGKGLTIFDTLVNCLDEHGLCLKNVLTLGRDGPNVNKTVENLLNEKLKYLKYKPLLKFGSCYLHIVNNAFKKGLDILSVKVFDFIIALKKFFDNSDVRWSEFEEIQIDVNVELHKFLDHCESRWLTIGPASDRISEQLPAVQEYFLNFLPKKDSNIFKNYYYKTIVSFLENHFLEVTPKFISHWSKIFAKTFTKFMQRKEPLVHLIYARLEKLIMIIATSVIKPKLEIQEKRRSLSTKTFFVRINYKVF